MSIAGLGIAVALTLAPGMDTATAAGTAAPAASSYTTHITQADTAVSRAIRKVHSHQYSGARRDLAIARRSHQERQRGGTCPDRDTAHRSGE